MVLSLAAYVYATVRTEEQEFEHRFALFMFLADLFVAGAIGPTVPM